MKISNEERDRIFASNPEINDIASIKCKGTTIYVGKNYRYAKFVPHKWGFAINYTNDIPDKGFAVPVDASGNVCIPKSFRLCYDIDIVAGVNKRTTGMKVFVKRKKDAQLPKPIYGVLNRDPSGIDLNKYRKVQDCFLRTNGSYRLYVGPLFPEDWAYWKITVHMGTCIRMDVQCADETDIESIPSYKEIREEYGNNMQYFLGDSFSFIYDPYSAKSVNVSRNNVPLTKLFKARSGIKAGDIIEVWLNESNNTYVLSPKAKNCEYTQDVIDCREEIPQKAVVCEKCDEEKDDIGACLEEISAIHKILESLSKQCIAYQNKCNELAEENNMLTKRLLENESKIRRLVDVLSE